MSNNPRSGERSGEPRFRIRLNPMRLPKHDLTLACGYCGAETTFHAVPEGITLTFANCEACGGNDWRNRATEN